MKKLSLLLFLLTALPTVLAAQEAIPACNRAQFVPQHELRLTAGAYPLLPYINTWHGCDADHPAGFSRTHRGPVYTSGVWSLAYDYRFRKWFDLGLAFSYYGEYSTSYNNSDFSFAARNRSHAITVMPVARFTWLNRRWVRMYSSLGLGATFAFGELDHNTDYFRETSAALQFTPIGISVGRSLFGFAEIGLGAQGTLMLGIGYQFNPKHAPTK
ncbi:MAG: hypothetical protein K2K43_04825 [Alistipes sp.]|nr:hypothetical protein [Alistipes sp.]